jgi:hypothetical protein
MRILLYLTAAGLVAIHISGCDVRYRRGSSEGGNEKQTIEESRVIGVEPATDQECASGGAVYVLFNDANKNGFRDVEEDVLHRQVVCNGSDGQGGTNGFNTLFKMDRVATGLGACASGSGLQVAAGLDADRSGALEASEIGQAQVLCDGANGSVGAAGPAGVNGVNMVFTAVAASASQCSSGGSNILMALDVNRTGAYSPSQPVQQSVTI